ncbi:MAG TPA: hypothetical protein PLQ93_06910 [Bacteroidia bacterium]|nr:hypothetical protein [Bacteroidia bacterium]
MEKNHKIVAYQNFYRFGHLYLFFQLLLLKTSAQQFTCTPGHYYSFLSTGVTIQNNAQVLAPINSIDSYWQCGTLPNGGQFAQVIAPNTNCGQSSTPSLFARWIGPGPTAAQCAPQPPSYWACLAANNTIIDFWYVRSFSLPVNSVFTIDWNVLASGWVDEIWVNNDLAYKTCATYSNHPSHSNVGVRFKWCKFNNTLNNTQNIIRIKVSTQILHPIVLTPA